MLGGWTVDVELSKMPQKVATAVAELNNMVGCEYSPIAYLGSQIVNGTNHAVLCEQTIILSKDVKNIVVVIFNETKEGIAMSSINTIIESGGELGGVKVDATTDIPDEAMAAFNKTLEGYVGARIIPFALLGTQVTKGVNYIFAATLSPVVQNPEDEAIIIVTNPMTKFISIKNILTQKHDVANPNQFGYAFSW